MSNVSYDSRGYTSENFTFILYSAMILHYVKLEIGMNVAGIAKYIPNTIVEDDTNFNVYNTT